MRKVERRHLCGNSNSGDLDAQIAKRMFGKMHRTVELIPLETVKTALPSSIKMTLPQEQTELVRDKMSRFAEDERNVVSRIRDEGRLRKLEIRTQSLSSLPNRVNSKRVNCQQFDGRKKNINQNAGLETQQVSQLEYVKKSEDGQCNLQKVMDFKSTLRRRYFYARQVIQIFKTWAQTQPGKVLKEDIERMSANLGLPLNSQEAETLMTVMTKGKGDCVTCEQFCDSLYQDSFFEQLQENGWYQLDGNGKRLKTFVREQANSFLRKEARRTLDDNLTRHLAETFTNQVTGQPIKVDFEKFLDHARASVAKWTDGISAAAKDIFSAYQKDGMIDLKQYWEGMCEAKPKAESQLASNLKTFDSAIEKEFYLKKSKRELPDNQLNTNMRKIRKVSLSDALRLRKTKGD